MVEYWESENNYRSARYYDEYVMDPVTRKQNAITFVCQHLDDQFMTGDDDATSLSVALCSGDSSKVSIPAMTIDRTMATDNILFQMATTPTPMFDVLTQSNDAQAVFNAAAKRPTFVSLNVEGKLLNNKETLSIVVEGEVAPGILPDGEEPCLTVYLMERDVESDSQLFWNEKEKNEYQGVYTHPNVIWEVLTDPMGEKVAENHFKKEFTAEVYPEYNKDNLYVVAFVHRDGKLGGKRMQVFNSARGDITDALGIEDIQNSKFKIQNDIYDLSGRKWSMVNDQSSMPKGIYIHNGKKIVR